MSLTEEIYGIKKISEPVVLELLETTALQRLKKINQNGVQHFLLSIPDFSRFDHSLGVFCLLRKFNASLEEQVAGLLHDVSHTAFSHVIDVVFENKNHNSHENFKEKIVFQSDIPLILEKHGFNVKEILNEKNFGLLERNLPDLCADRLDYSFHSIIHDIQKPVKRVHNFISSLTVFENEFVFKDFYSAKEFALDYMALDKGFWSNPIFEAAYHILAEAIKEALEKKVLTEKDLFETDEFVLNKLLKSNNSLILEKIKMLSPRFNAVRVFNEKEFDFHAFSKFRAVNPKFLQEGKIMQVSDLDSKFGEEFNEYRAQKEKGYKIRILN